jgi:hypothetical protein
MDALKEEEPLQFASTRRDSTLHNGPATAELWYSDRVNVKLQAV